MSKVHPKQLIINKKNNIFLIILFAFALYCSLIIGETWDHADNLIRGKITLDYLFSFGNIDNGIAFREYYSTIYWSFLHLVTKQFPLQYQIQITHFINLVFSLSTIIAIGKVTGELFNKKIGKITLIVLFFYPIFFGHMGINTKDTILAFSHVWITYLLFRYIKKQQFIAKRNKYIVFIPILAAIGTGIQLVFLGSLVPILIFILSDILIFKKITPKSFIIKIFLYDLIKSFLIFYFLLILFWIDTHSNILVLPFSIILQTLSESYLTGWPYNLINGSYYLSNSVPKYYLIINLFYKSPEYFLLCYFIFAILLFSSKKFFNQNIVFFNYKICLLFLILFFPNIIFFLVPFPLYDGMRLFLWTLPYFCIIPGIVIYFLIENYKNVKSKITLIVLSTFIIYFLANFLTISPYQYTYLNFFNGKKENRYKKFENDYWGSSIGDLVRSFTFGRDAKLIFSTCGINNKILESALIKNGYTNFSITNGENAEYIVMTNRAIKDGNAKNNLKLTNCFDKFDGREIFTIKRNGMLLSALRKNN